MGSIDGYVFTTHARVIESVCAPCVCVGFFGVGEGVHPKCTGTRRAIKN